MKRFLILFLTIILSSLSGFALDYPRWQNMPINVYIPSGNKYSQLMLKAFNEWQNVTAGILRFKYVDSKEKADIFVNFTGSLGSNGNGTHAIGLTHYGYIKNGFYTKNQIDIDTNKYFGDKSNKRGESIRIYHVMLHEIGHAIGLNHSDNINSLMYYMYEKKETQEITKFDINTVKKKYL